MTEQPLILQVIPSLLLGGAERFVVELCARLPTYGYRTRLVVLYDRGSLWEDVRARDIRWSQLLESFSGSRLELLSRLTKKIYDASPRRPAIVHSHLFGGDFWTALSRSLHRFRRRVDEWDVPEPLLVSTAHNVDHADGTIMRLARRWAVRRIDHIAAVSKQTQQFVISDLGAKAGRVSQIDGMNFLDIDPPRPDAPFHDPPRFITVGRLVPQKGHETALRALANVPPPWSYTIIGYGELERDLKELAEKLGIASRVHFAGPVADVRDMLRDADVFLFPSRWEGLGSAVLEAAGANLPVLVSDLPPLQDVFPASIRLPVDDVDAWSAAIRHVLKSPEEALKRTRRLAPAIRKRFDPDTVTAQYAELYGRLLAGRRHR